MVREVEMSAGMRWRRRLAIVAWVLAVPTAASQQAPSQATPAALARDEGVLRLIIERCFAGEPRQLGSLRVSSERYVKALSSSSGIRLAELERLADDSLRSARETRQVSKEQCAANRESMLKVIRERDAALKLLGW